MSRNRRRNDNSIELASIVKWTLLASILVGFGLCFVYLKVQMHEYGKEKNRLEKELEVLAVKNDALRGQITTLTSRGELQRQVDSGFVQLVDIPDTAIVRIQPARLNRDPEFPEAAEILPVNNQLPLQ